MDGAIQMKRPGVIYQLEDDRFGIAYNDAQEKAFKKIKKILVHLYTGTDATDLKPILTEKGTHKKVLKSEAQLIFKGYTD